MEVKREKLIEEVLDEYNISWSYGDKDKTLKTLNMFKEFIEKEVNDAIRSCAEIKKKNEASLSDGLEPEDGGKVLE